MWMSSLFNKLFYVFISQFKYSLYLNSFRTLPFWVCLRTAKVFHMVHPWSCYIDTMGCIKLTRPRVICPAGVRSSVTAKFPFWHNKIISFSRFEMANKNIISQTIPRLLGYLETSGANNQARRRHITEEGIPQGNRCGNLNARITYFISIWTRLFLYFIYL